MKVGVLVNEGKSNLRIAERTQLVEVGAQEDVTHQRGCWLQNRRQTYDGCKREGGAPDGST